MKAVAIVMLDWTEEPLPASISVPIHHRSEVTSALADRPEMGVGLVVLPLKYGDRWAVSSSSSPGTWHCVVLVERNHYVGARCSCTAGQFAGNRVIACSHTAAVLRQVVKVEAERESVGMAV